VLHVADLQPGAFGVLSAQSADPSAVVAHSSSRWGSPTRR
jgi:hypothetical protein